MYTLCMALHLCWHMCKDGSGVLQLHQGWGVGTGDYSLYYNFYKIMHVKTGCCAWSDNNNNTEKACPIKHV